MMYTVLASFYDKLNASVDYRGIYRFVSSVFKENGVPEGAMLLDLACGTGVLTVPFAKAGYDMIAVDLSADMLMTARERSDEEEVCPLYLCQDMRELDLYGTVDGGYCCLNSLNYLDTQDDLEKVFDRLKYFVAPGGVFVFDVNTAYKFINVYGDKTYVYDEEDVFCVWQNHTEVAPLASEFTLTFFAPDKKGKYCRFEEGQRQTYFAPEDIERAYRKAGFETLGIYGSVDRDAPKDTDEAIWFVIKRVL